MSVILEMVTPPHENHVPMPDARQPPEAVPTQMLVAPLVTQALRVVAELGVACRPDGASYFYHRA